MAILVKGTTGLKNIQYLGVKILAITFRKELSIDFKTE